MASLIGCTRLHVDPAAFSYCFNRLFQSTRTLGSMAKPLDPEPDPEPTPEPDPPPDAA